MSPVSNGFVFSRINDHRGLFNSHSTGSIYKGTQLEKAWQSLACSLSGLTVPPLANSSQTNPSTDLRLCYTQCGLVNSEVTVRKFIKFLPEVEMSSSSNLFISALRYSNPFWNASVMNEGGLSIFCRFVPKLVAIATSHE